MTLTRRLFLSLCSLPLLGLVRKPKPDTAWKHIENNAYIWEASNGQWYEIMLDGKYSGLCTKTIPSHHHLGGKAYKYSYTISHRVYYRSV